MEVIVVKSYRYIVIAFSIVIIGLFTMFVISSHPEIANFEA